MSQHCRHVRWVHERELEAGETSPADFSPCFIFVQTWTLFGWPIVVIVLGESPVLSVDPALLNFKVTLSTLLNTAALWKLSYRNICLGILHIKICAFDFYVGVCVFQIKIPDTCFDKYNYMIRVFRMGTVQRLEVWLSSNILSL